MPILGIIASSKFTPVVELTDFNSISTVTVGSGGTATINFTSIPATYTHLQIRAIGRITNTDNKPIIQFNSDTTQTNYYQHAVFGNSSGVSAWAYNNNWISYWPQSTNDANVFGTFVIDLLDYTNTNKYKTVRSLGGFDASSGYAWYNSLLWSNTNAITSITLKPNDSSNFAQYSSFALYGIKGA